MGDVTKLEKLRACGRLETYSTARHHLGFYKNVGLTATYTSTTAFSVPLESLVFQALREVIPKHPALSAITVNEDQSYPNVYFARLPEIDMRTCVEFHERASPFPGDGEADVELDGLLAEQHSRDFKDEFGKRPFWRLIVVTSAKRPIEISVSWFFHHALADGTSALLFHDSFLAALNSGTPEKEAGPIVKSSALPLVLSLEELNPMKISWSLFLHAIFGSIFPSFVRTAKVWTGNPVPKDVDPVPKLNYRTLVFSAETTKRVAQISRREKSSVTATFQCLVAASLFASVPTEKYEKIKIENPISMRRFLEGIPADQMTNAITQYGYVHQRRVATSTNVTASVKSLPDFSWNEARTVKSSIQAEVAKSGRDNPIALLKYVSDMHGLFKGKLGKPRDPTSELSNIGVYKAKEEEGEGLWKISRMTFSQTANLTSCPFGVNIVTGADGNAVVNFAWSEGAVDEDLIVDVIGRFKEGVESVV